MDNKFLIAFLSIFAVIGLSVSVIYIAKWISGVVIKRNSQRKEKQAVIDHKLEELSGKTAEFLRMREELDNRMDYLEKTGNRVDNLLGIDVRYMDYTRIRHIEKRLDDMANDIAKQIVRIDELEGRLNG